jgi:hypothetical protein
MRSSLRRARMDTTKKDHEPTGAMKVLSEMVVVRWIYIPKQGLSAEVTGILKDVPQKTPAESVNK